MILNLYIENIAVIEKISIDFIDGFNVMTGETGAGKSIIIDSINLILGHRAPRDIIRTGAEKAFISATFDNLSSDTIKIIKDLGYKLDEDGILVIQREINVNGKGTCRVNSRPATVSSLKQIGQLLINIHGQHESVGLLSSDSHIKYIDSMCDIKNKLEKFTYEFNRIKQIKSDLNKINIDEDEKARKVDILKYQINEIESASPLEGEDIELKRKRDLYMNSQKISSYISKARSELNGDEENIGAIQLLESSINALFEISSYMPKAKDIYSRMQGLVYELEDCASELIDMSSDIEYDPNEAEMIEQRLDEIYKLTRKYGSNIDDVLDYLKNAREELENIEFSESNIEKLNNQLEDSKAKAFALAENISQKRKIASDEFSNKVKKELEFLLMPGVKFYISQTKGSLTSNGFDDIEFLISTNPGELPKPISKIASGGELSRIMLAIKNVIANKDSIDTLIFDEVDTGISGIVAQRVGLKLKEVSKNRQVICVTHSAQIAALADAHFSINKIVHNNRTYTMVKMLDIEERKKEIARIIGGEEITNAALANASEMIEIGKNR